ncbi:MAG TPA: S9 family peptidase [Pirellulales bacterium]|nr:S9 family peptidase [Pirellulales bacterium]
MHVFRRVRALLSVVLLLSSRTALAADEARPAYRIAAFSADVTIPLGHRCMGILPVKAQTIDDPLEAHGFVLLGPDEPVVLLALDWCEVRNGAYDQWRDALAVAAGTTRDRVLVSCLHQHDAPVVDSGAQTLLDGVGLSGELYDTAFHAACIDRTAAALAASLASARPVTHVGIGQAKVERVASSRRIVSAGDVRWDRYSSSGGNREHSEAPEGDIDPYLKTISFWHGDTPLVALHSYATHPMSYYGRGGVSADFVGLARRRRAKDDSRIAQIYVSGCSGDVTAGKYNDGTPLMRPVLADRIYVAMERAWDATERFPLEQVAFRTVPVDLPFHEGAEFTREPLERTLADGTAKIGDRILAAMGLSSLDRIARGQPIDLACLEIGRAKIVLFPGEAFVGYQLMAQRMSPDSFVLSIGYGECWPGYIPTEIAFAERFNHDWRWAGRGSEVRMRDALQKLLAAAPLLATEDLYGMEGPQSVVIAPDRSRAAFIRRWVDAETRGERFSLWLTDGDPSSGRSLEPDEPDARSPVFSPDGNWIAIRSTRGRPDGWVQTPAVPPQSDAATDIWLVSADGRRTLPLAGREKPYGRVFNDPFYGRVAFSPDGRFLAFVADDGRDPRTAEELAADVYVVRPDQGEGYTGYGAAQVWVAELDLASAEHAAKNVRRLTDDAVWYGDVQWSPDGRTLFCHANKTEDVEAVRHSINKDFDIWAIDVASGDQRQVTDGPGPEVSPRVSPDGSRLICLSSPRKGPHVDILNLRLVALEGSEAVPPQRILYDHHASPTSVAPHPVPAFPLPDECWDGTQAVWYTHFRRMQTDTVRVDLETAQGVCDAATVDPLSPLAQCWAARERLSPPSTRLLKQRWLAEERVVTWSDDEWQLEGTITIPPRGKAPYPLVVYPHGGPHSRSTNGFGSTAQILAAHGYLVFQPNFRGSAGYGLAFLDADRRDFGGGDMRDILSGIDLLVDRGLADAHRQFVYGISYGGYMTCWLVGHTKQFAAAVAQNAVTDLNVMWGTSDIQSWTQWELGGSPWEIADAMRRHSPITYVDQVTTPTLILHSRDDRRCPLPMGRMYHQSLLARHVPTGMVVYPDEGHSIRQPRHQVDVLRRVLDWFAEHDPGRSRE